MKPTVVITKISPRWNYFQYFILGFYLLKKDRKINLKFRCNPFYILSTVFSNAILCKIFARLHKMTQYDSYNMYGYIKYSDGKTKKFCIDSADAPFLFEESTLKNVDAYFKMQCPKGLNPLRGFALTDEVYIPYCDHAHKNRNLKLTDRGERRIFNISPYLNIIRPLMVGFRKLSDSNSFVALNEAYENYKSSRHNRKEKILMCYFGNDKGPKPSETIDQIDYDWESDIMGFFSDHLEHPNVKRGKITNMIKDAGDEYDGRIISESYADSNGVRHEELIVPLKDFCDHISKFHFNMNVSGYRMSIPNRFIESFVVGTKILTDKLCVKWYLPFDDEVMETVEMGYYPSYKVDWSKFKQDLKRLPACNHSEKVIDLFERKWAPESVAQYIIEELRK